MGLTRCNRRRPAGSGRAAVGWPWGAGGGVIRGHDVLSELMEAVQGRLTVVCADGYHHLLPIEVCDAVTQA